MTPETTPFDPKIEMRRAAARVLSDPPMGPSERNPFSSICRTMKPISSEWASIITRGADFDAPSSSAQALP